MPTTEAARAAPAPSDDSGKRRRTSEEPRGAARSQGEEDDSDDAPLLPHAAPAPEQGAAGGAGASASSGPQPATSPSSADSDSESDSDGNAAVMKALADSDAEPVQVRSRGSKRKAAGKPAPAPAQAPGGGSGAPPPAPGAEAGAEAAGAAAAGAAAAGAGAGAAAAAASESSDSESSSEESSSSSSETESLAGEAEEPAERRSAAGEGTEPPPEDEETRRRRELGLLHAAQLRRDEIAAMLLGLPEEEAENAILRSFVRLTAAQASCVLAEVSGIERSAAYTVPMRGDRGVDARTVAVQLRCKRGASTRLIKITSVSNTDATEAEFEQWKRLSQRAGVDAEYYLEQMRQKAQDIGDARRFSYTEAQVSKRLRARPNPEFDAQKESRMRFLVQCALSQMDISGIRDYESDELDARYREALRGLQVQEQQSARMQEEWFEKRPNLFSLKVINQKNLDRQIRDDRHALHYALETEEGAGAGAVLNPFKRRDCRPIVAWDTKLTAVEELGGGAEAAAEASAPAAAAAPAEAARAPEAAPAAEAAAGAAEDAALSRVDRVMRAHRRADLLAKLGPLAALQAA